jgi:hypothetical protein
VTWYNKLTLNWATWEPGEPVQPGTVGFFDEQQRFAHYRTLADWGIVPRIAVAGLPDRHHQTQGDFQYSLKASGRSPDGFESLGTLDAGLRMTANREHACVLHMRDLSEAKIKHMDAVLGRIKELLLKGEWEIDSVVVASRVEARKGFAAVSLGSGRTFEAKADGDARLAGIADLGRAALELASRRDRGDFLFYDFGPGSTPSFSAIRVKRGLWDRLLPWRRDGGVLIDPNGRAYRELPENLIRHALEARRYDPAKSLMPAAELAAIAVEDLFEEVAELPGEEDSRQSYTGGRLLSFPLPVPPGPAALAAADPGDGAPPVVTAASPDGLARFALFRRDDGEYWLEVSTDARTEVPLLARLRYTTAESEQRELLVPVQGDSRSSSVVALLGYDGGAWRAWAPVPLATLWPAAADLVEVSIRSALTVATVRAWERLASAGPEDGRELITRAVEAPDAEDR